MRFSNNYQLNNILKITYKSVLLLLLLIYIALDLGFYLHYIVSRGWVVDWDGRVVVYSKNNVWMFISNYFSSFSNFGNLFLIYFLVLGIMYHHTEAKRRSQSYPFAMFLFMMQFYGMVIFLFVALPFSGNVAHMQLPSLIISRIIIPLAFGAYIMIWMENKNWYSVREFTIKYSTRISAILIFICCVYVLLWFGKFSYFGTNDLFHLTTVDLQQYLAPNGAQNHGMLGIKVGDKALLRSLTQNDWNNHGLIFGNVLLTFSDSTAIFGGHVKEWESIFIALAIWYTGTFGVIPLLILWNKKIVTSKNYIIIQGKSDGSDEVVDFRDEISSLDMTPLLKKKRKDCK